jgi:hypothetical protein
LSVDRRVGSLQEVWKAGEMLGVASGWFLPGAEEKESLPELSLQVVMRAWLARPFLQAESFYLLWHSRIEERQST